MNKAYRSLYNERTGTFVAVAEHSKARGKKSSSQKKIVSATALSFSLLTSGVAFADIELNQGENKIQFTQHGGIIDFGGQGQIQGLAQLTISGELNANQILVDTIEPLTSASKYVVTGGQLYQTNQDVVQLNQRLTQTSQSLVQATTDLNQLADRVDQHATQLSDHSTQLEDNKTQLSDHSSQLSGHQTLLTEQKTTIESIQTALSDAGIDKDTPGVKYFRANSTAADAQAIGAESIAIGPQAKAIGNASVALGVGAQAEGTAALAIGEATQAQSENSSAIGSGAKVDGEFAAGALAVGHGAAVTGSAANAIAVGSQAQSSSTNAVALGTKATSSGADAVAVGTGARGLSANTIALGTGASAEAIGNIAMGTRAGLGANLGAPNPGLDRTNQIAIGTEAGQYIDGNQTTSIGYKAGNGAKSDYFVAIGNLAGQGLDGHANVSIGHEANQQVQGTAVEHAVSVGSNTQAGSFAVALGADARAAKESLAIGHSAAVSGEYGIALGSGAQAVGNSVALGAQSVAQASTGRGYLSDFNIAKKPINVVAMGRAGSERRLTHVAAGAVDTDAVNVSQLKAAQLNLAEILGNGVIDESGKVTAFSVGNQKYNTVAEALGTIASGGQTINPAGAVLYQQGSNNGVVEFQGVGGTVLKNVAMSSNPDDKDAVNVAYLNDQLAEKTPHYFSVKSTTEFNHNNQGAEGANSMAIGPAAHAMADSSIALGHVAKTKAPAKESVVIGTDVTAEQERSIVMGVKSHAYGKSNITLGDDAHSHGDNSIVIGKGAKADPKLPTGTVNNAIALGTSADVTADSGTAVGHDATASGVQGVAVGFRAYAQGEDSLALGSRADAQALESIAQGAKAIASGVRSQAQGSEARATATDGIALGSNAVSGIINPNPNESVNNINTIAIGNQSTASFKNAMATGTQARATHENAIASGFQAEATADNAVALGAKAKASHERAVALGDGAQTSAAVGTTGARIDKKEYVYAGQQPIATVSVGSAGNERTITHVAAGRVSATSTDAINGSQLYGAHVAINELGDDLDTAGQSVADALGGSSSYNPQTHKVTASLNVQGNTYNTVNEAINYAAQGWGLTATGVAGTETIKPGETANFSAGKNIVVDRTGNTITYKTADDVEFNQVNVDNSITIGDDVTNQTVINQGSVSTTNLTVTGETKLGDHFNVTNQGDVHYTGPITKDTHIVNKEYVDKTEKDLTAKGMKFVGNDGQVIHKNLGETLGIVGGLTAGAAASAANITTVQNANGELEIQLAKNLTDLETVQVDNSITIGDDVTNQTVINQGSVSTKNLTVTGETKLGDHFSVTNQGDVHYTGPITDTTHIVNKEYVDKAGDELTAKGMKFVGNDGQVIHKNLGETLGIVGGLAAGAAASSANITTVQNADGELEIQLAKNLTDLETVQVDNSITIGDDVTNQTVINQGSVSTTNLTVTGETKLGDHFSVTNQGDVHYDGPITDTTHIVNKEYVDKAGDELTAKGMKFVGNDGQAIHKDLGETLGIVGGLTAGAAASAANITTVQNANGELEIQLAKNLTDLETVQVDNSITIGDDVTNQTVINQGSVSTTNLTVTGETKLGDHFNVTNQGDVHYTGDITDGSHIINKDYLNQELSSAIANSGWHLSTGVDTDKTKQYVAPQQEVNLVNKDDNLSLTQIDITEVDADGNEVVVGQRVDFELASTLQIGAKDADGSVGDNPQIIIGEDGAGQGVPGITVPGVGGNQGAVTIGGGDVTIDWVDQAGQKTPIAVGETLMKGLNFSGNNYAAADADSVVNKKFGERLEILGVDWIETEVKDGAIYIKLADNFPVVPKPEDNAGGGAPGGGGNGGSNPGDGLGNIVAGGDIQGGNNINVRPGDDDHSLIIETTPDVEHNSVTVGDVVINQDGIHAGNTQITGVADGTQNDHAVNLGQLKDSINQLDQDLTHKGMNFADSKGNTVHRDLGETLHIVGANANITTQVDQKGILEIALSDDLNVDSITINNGGPVIDVNGIDMSNKTITNVAPGIEVNDAVNVGQLHDVRDNLQGQVNVIRRDMHRMDRKLRGGVAAAMATASLPQAYLPGKSMMAIAGGTWAGESGMAIGYSGISDNGKWIMKLSGNSTTRGDYGGAVGVGFQW